MDNVWPNFFIVGAAKAGTTSLYHYLSQHPDVYMSPIKEPHYFSQVKPSWKQRFLMEPVLDEGAYLKLFYGARGKKAVGEASPSYLWDQAAPFLIKEKVPEAKIIMLLRDPVERAFSHYLMDVRQGVVKGGFLEELKKDFEDEKKGWGISHLYVELGFYHEQIARYKECFSEDNIKIILFDDLVRSEVDFVREVAIFLGLKSDFVFSAEAKNTFSRSRFIFFKNILKVFGAKNIAKKFISEDKIRFFKEKLFFSQGERPILDEDSVDFLRKIYDYDHNCLKRDFNISFW